MTVINVRIGEKLFFYTVVDLNSHYMRQLINEDYLYQERNVYLPGEKSAMGNEEVEYNL